jgi:hypothetical protein
MRRAWWQDGCLDLFFLVHALGRFNGSEYGRRASPEMEFRDFAVLGGIKMQDVKFVDRRCSYQRLGGYEE